MAEVKWRNVHRSDPCRICGKPDWCSRSDDGVWSLCRRIDAGGEHRVDRAGAEYWLHCLGGMTPPPPELPAASHPERANPADLDRVYRAVLGDLSLSDEHRDTLLLRGLDEAAIGAGQYRTLPSRGRAALARSMLERFPARLLEMVPGFCLRDGDRGRYLTFTGPAGLVVPVVDLDRRIMALKVRRDEPGDEAKYLYVSSTASGGPGPGSPVHVPPWNGSTAQVRVTEGELKADVATRLSGVLTISVPGVSAWRGALPVLKALAPTRVLLAFDTDGATNPQVARATEATAEALAQAGYEVAQETWESAAAKGIDDALVRKVPISVQRHLRTSPPETPSHDEQVCYRATPEGLFWDRRTRDGPVAVRLANFRAMITSDVLDDDGAEVRRSFEVEARLNGHAKRITLAAGTFAGMTWVTEHLGARAIVYPGLGIKDHARTAIQILSAKVPERRVYSHTGWRLLEQGWAYLHAGGAIGASGALAGIEVVLPEALARMALPEPPAHRELEEAVRASLRLVDVAPDPITLPLLAATYRAVLGDTDFALALSGPSGAGKSELAALAQRHFGSAMDARHLPGSWSSTANALEMLAFSAKDALLVVDDFAPGGSSGDTERAHRDADRLLRAQGNRSGRIRMRPDGTLRASKPPRGLIVSTGEDVPRGESLRARLLVCDVGPKDVDWRLLTECQGSAAEGLCARAMAGFLQWVAARYDPLRGALNTWMPELRQAATASVIHRRTPEILASLAAGFGAFLAFARSAGAITEPEQEALWGRAWRALGEAASAQAQHQSGAEVAQRFLELLRGAIAAGRAHLAGPEGDRPHTEESWGWRGDHHGNWEPKGERVGWLDGDQVYLEPDAAYAAVQRLGTELGDRLGLTPQTLRRRLKERGVLVSTEPQRRMLTVRRTLEGHRRDVLHMHKFTLSPPAPDADRPDGKAQDCRLERCWSAISGGSADGRRGATATSSPLPALSRLMVGVVGTSPR